LDRLSLLNAAISLISRAGRYRQVASHRKLRLLPNDKVRLRYAYVIECQEVVRDPETGEPIELKCVYYPESRRASRLKVWDRVKRIIYCRGVDGHPVHRQPDRLFLPKSQKRKWRLSEGSQPDLLEVLKVCWRNPARGKRRTGHFGRNQAE
jgi:hypothetical protein